MQASKFNIPQAVLEVTGNEEVHICPICLEAILEATSDREGHEAVFCKGVSCCLWYHRWCAGVTEKRYDSMADSDALFLCPACMMGQQSCVIAALQGAVISLTIQITELQLQHTLRKAAFETHELRGAAFHCTTTAMEFSGE